MRDQQEAFTRQIEQMQANKGDPMIDMMRENTRMQVEQMREVTRLQQDQSSKMSQFMVAPAQLAAIMKDSAAGADAVIRNIVGSVDGIVNMYRNVAEHAVELAGGGPGDPPVVRMIEQGLGRASEIAERYLSVKRDQTVSDSKVKTAQAQAVAAQFQAHTAQVNAQANARSVSGDLSGAAPPSAPPSSPEINTPPATPVGIPRRKGSEAEAEAKVIPIHSPPTEEEMFGIAADSVKRLRKGVADGELDPEKAIDAILKGVEYAVQNHSTIPAFLLFQEERWADFIDVLLPNAPQAFKDECIRIIVEEIEVVHADPPAPEVNKSSE
jgi:hypothetical protein